jgi:hypothetical protein
MKKTYSTPLVTASDVVRTTTLGVFLRPILETNTITRSNSH